MLSKLAIRKYLGRDLDSFTWIKEEKHWELNQALKGLDVPTKKIFYTKPYHHQKACFLIGVYHWNFLFFLEMGLGKTKIALDLARYHMDAGNVNQALILVPNLVNIENWEEEVKIHQPNTQVVAMYGDTDERMRRLYLPGEVFVLNYAGFMRMVCTLQPKKKGTGKELVIDKAKQKEVMGMFDMVVFDESTVAKNHQSQTFKICNQLSKQCKVRYALTGTPMGRDPQDFWGQFYLVDRGETLGQALGVMRDIFFKKQKKQFAKSRFAYEYHFDPKMEKELSRILQHRSITYEADEARDMPRKVYTKRHAKLPMEAEEYMKYVMRELKEAGGEWNAVNNSYLRMRQICSGFLGLKGDDTGEKLEIAFQQNPKLELLETMLTEELDPSKKFIVFNEFIYSGKLISDMLARHSIKHVRLWGGTKDKVGAIQQFKNDPKCRGLVANSASADKGLNLQVARHMFFYESSDSPITRAQAEARIRRGKQKGLKKNQKGRVFYTDLIIRGSVEEKILHNLKEGKNLRERLQKGESYEQI